MTSCVPVSPACSKAICIRRNTQLHVHFRDPAIRRLPHHPKRALPSMDHPRCGHHLRRQTMTTASSPSLPPIFTKTSTTPRTTRTWTGLDRWHHLTISVDDAAQTTKVRRHSGFEDRAQQLRSHRGPSQNTHLGLSTPPPPSDNVPPPVLLLPQRTRKVSRPNCPS